MELMDTFSCFVGPINKLEMASSKTYFDNKTRQEVFVFYENEPSSVACNFHGSGPPPVMHIIRGELDITPLFERAQRVEVVGELGLQYSMYHIDFQSSDLKMERTHDGQKLYCVAQVPTFTELSLTKTAVIKVLCKLIFLHFTEQR